jgi:hypothetical protein
MMRAVRDRFLIVGTYRCGTSAIVEALGRHPDILCGMEWTHHVAPWRMIRAAKAALTGDFSGLPARQRDALASSPIEQKTAIGFKRLFRSSNKWLLHPRFAPALALDRLTAHIRWLRRDPAIRVIHIVRLDNLAWLRSKLMSDATGSFSGARYPDDLKLSMPVGEARRRVIAKSWIDRKLADLHSSNPYLRVDYESFVADNRAVAQRIVDFLGCDPAALPLTELRHQSQSASSGAKILNEAEIRGALGDLARISPGC